MVGQVVHPDGLLHSRLPIGVLTLSIYRYRYMCKHWLVKLSIQMACSTPSCLLINVLLLLLLIHSQLPIVHPDGWPHSQPSCLLEFRLFLSKNICVNSGWSSCPSRWLAPLPAAYWNFDSENGSFVHHGSYLTMGKVSC